MTDNGLIALLMRKINEGLEAQGLSVPPQVLGRSAVAQGQIYVLQKWQPTQQGIPTAPTVYVEKLFDDNYGFPMRKQVFNQDEQNFDVTLTQNVETTIQISAWATQDSSDLSLPTASDIANAVRLWFCLPEVSASMMKSDQVNVLRTTRVTNPYIEDDRDRAEATPSFDLVITHHRSIATVVPMVSSVEINAIPVP